MGQFRDILPSQGWLHELARAEVHPDADRLLQLGNSFDPQQLVEETTIDLLNDLREMLFRGVCAHYARNFETLTREQPGPFGSDQSPAPREGHESLKSDPFPLNSGKSPKTCRDILMVRAKSNPGCIPGVLPPFFQI